MNNTCLPVLLLVLSGRPTSFIAGHESLQGDTRPSAVRPVEVCAKCSSLGEVSTVKVRIEDTVLPHIKTVRTVTSPGLLTVAEGQGKIGNLCIITDRCAKNLSAIRPHTSRSAPAKKDRIRWGFRRTRPMAR